VSPSAAERLAALRAPSKTRGKPAHTSKVLAAGISTTALLGMVAVMGWQSGTGTAQSTVAVAPAAQAATPTVAPVVADPTVARLVPAVPVAAVPLPAAPVVIPVAVPVAQLPVQQAAPAASNTTTKTSG
jgi:hypothetical protein